MLDNRRRRVPWRIIFEVVGLLLLVIGGSTVLVLQRRAHTNGASQSPTIAKGITASSSSAHATSRANMIAADVTPTPTPFFSDAFSHDNTNGWYISDAAGYTRLLTDNGLQLTATNHKPLIESLPTSHLFDDFSLTVLLALQRGDDNDSTGIYLRGDSNLDHDYRIDIFGNNTYTISKESLGADNTVQSTYLVLPTHTPQLKPMGTTNILKVVMQGPTLQLLLNGSLVNSISDSEYTKGQIALFVTNGATSPGVTALFNSIQIDPIMDGPSGK